jgi:ATP-dependent Clp protease ATP-binding subunit ClpC
VLIMTSNIGAELIKNKAGFGFAPRSEEADYQKMKKTLLSEIERYFRPEFINRLDDVIVFRPLSRENLIGIVEYELKKVRGRLKDREMSVDLDEKAKDFLIEKGYNPDFGARPLRRAIEQFLEDPLSEAILRGELKAGQLIRITREEGADSLKILTPFWGVVIPRFRLSPVISLRPAFQRRGPFSSMLGVLLPDSWSFNTCDLSFPER